MSKRARSSWGFILIVGLVCIGGALAGAQSGDAASPAYRVLIVDGTKTLTSTMRVMGLASGIEQSGMADVDALVADELDSFDDPLTERPAPDEPYDLIILVPRGVDDGTVYGIWILLAGDAQSVPEVAQAVALLGQGIDAAFSGIASAVKAGDDLWAALTAALYVREGWLR